MDIVRSYTTAEDAESAEELELLGVRCVLGGNAN
jgi:hypothetical protein